jgi:acyl carrier protein phosphodiesterase
VNYLFHLYLSGDDPDIITGNFMGDFVKGRLGNDYPPRLQRGIELHRRIDSFAQNQTQFNQSRLRLDQSFGLYRGILVDLFYDHFLATTWKQWSPEPLTEYLQRVRGIVESREPYLPERLRELLPIIFQDMIPSYLEAEGVGRALARMSKRVKRENPLAGGGVELLLHYEELRGDFLKFLPAAREFVDLELEKRGSRTLKL